MQTGGEAADQVVKMSLEGAEVAVRLAGDGAVRIAALLVSIMREENKTRGKAQLDSMLRSGKELKVFTIRNQDLKKFTQEAKKYGVLYNVLADRKTENPKAPVDIIARAEDAAKINRIMERFHLSHVDVASVVAEAEKSKSAAQRRRTDKQKRAEQEAMEEQPGGEVISWNTKQSEPDGREQVIDELFGQTKPEESKENPFQATTKKEPQSAPSSETAKVFGTDEATEKRHSVRAELQDIKARRRQQEKQKPTAQEKSTAKKPAQTVHKQPTVRKPKGKSRGR